MQLPANLSRRELQIVQLLASGAKNRQIAATLELSAHTVKRHIARIMTKMKVESRNQAASIYRRHGHEVGFRHWGDDSSSAEGGLSGVDVTPARELTARELEVLMRIANGAGSRQIAGELLISFHTVKRHTASIFGKLGVQNRSHATAFVHAARREMEQSESIDGVIG
jgi:DNA-binding NarL/FixJ family response regulator